MILIIKKITILVILCKVTWSEDARGRLKGAGYRLGAAGMVVVEYLASQPCCRGAQEIHEALTDAGHTIGLASVYRMVDRLAVQGLLQRVDIGDGIVRYEPARETEHHHHLVCGDCGKVEPFVDPPLERAIEALEERSGYSVFAHEVLLRGVCRDCRAPASA